MGITLSQLRMAISDIKKYITNNTVSNEVLNTHESNTAIHVTKQDKDNWNSILENAKQYANNLFDGISKFNIEIVDALPDTGDINKIYFVPKSKSTVIDSYDEFMYINSKWEFIGNTNIDLSDYAKKTDLHVHLNKSVLDKFSESDNGKVLYDGVEIATPEEQLESFKYTDSEGAMVAVGGFSVGEKADKMSFQDFAYKILHPYMKPTLSIKINPSNTVYDATGSGISSITITATVAKKSNPINNVNFYLGSTLLESKETDVSNGGTFSYTYKPDTPITSTVTFKVSTNDGTNTVTSNITITFIGSSYYGAVSASTTNPTETDIKALVNKSLKTTKGLTYSNISMIDSKICYAYPKSLGALTSIKDANNIQYINSYTRTEVTVDGIDYYVYTLTDAATVSAFTQTYA